VTMLGHLKVVDLTRDLGGYAGVMLAELGADVVQIEWADPVGDAAEVAMARRGKRVERLALEDAALATLVEGADILLRGPEAMPEGLGKTNARLIDVAILPFDPDGRNAGRPATDLTLMARSGRSGARGARAIRGSQAWPTQRAWGGQAIRAARHGQASRRRRPSGSRRRDRCG